MSNERTLHSFPPPHLLSDQLSRFFSGQNGDDLARVRAEFSANWDVYILGGAVRNLLLHELRGLLLGSADVDVVVNGPRSTSELQAAVQKFCIRQNDFGGSKCRLEPDGLIFDIWRIDDHATISSSPPPYTAHDLLRHNLLDVDAVVWDATTGYLHEYGCLAAIENGRIDLLREGIAPDFMSGQVAHVLLTTLNTGFELSAETERWVREVCQTSGNKEKVIQVLRRKAPEATAKVEQLLGLLLKGEAHPWVSLTIQ